PVQIEARFLSPDLQYCWIETTFSDLLDEPEVRAIVSNSRDITHRKTTEERLEREAAELERSNAELRSFAYAATHDLREPLRTIGAFTQLLLRERCDAKSKEKEYADLIVGGVNRMSMLLDGLLAFANLGSPDSNETLELTQAAKKAVQNLEQAIQESGARIEIGSLPVVRANEGQLVELFQNLFSNAI